MKYQTEFKSSLYTFIMILVVGQIPSYSSPYYGIKTLPIDLMASCFYEVEILEVEFKKIKRLKDTTAYLDKRNYHYAAGEGIDTVVYPIYQISIEILNKLSGNGEYDAIWARDQLGSFRVREYLKNKSKGSKVVILDNKSLIYFYTPEYSMDKHYKPIDIEMTIDKTTRVMESSLDCKTEGMSKDLNDNPCRCEKINDKGLISFFKKFGKEKYFYENSKKFEKKNSEYFVGILGGVFITIVIVGTRLIMKRNREKSV